MSPTARALDTLRRLGWQHDVVERTITRKIKKDFLGIIDIIAIDGSTTYGIQVTSGSNHAARRDKILASDNSVHWLKSPHRRREVWSYRKTAKDGWQLRRESITYQECYDEYRKRVSHG